MHKNKAWFRKDLAKMTAKDLESCPEESPLHLAVKRGKRAVVEAMLDLRFVEVNFGQASGCRTALHFAAEAGDVEMVETLLDYGADVDALNDRCEKPLHYAAKNLDMGEDVALALIHQGSAKVDAFNRYIRIIPGQVKLEKIGFHIFETS